VRFKQARLGLILLLELHLDGDTDSAKCRCDGALLLYYVTVTIAVRLVAGRTGGSRMGSPSLLLPHTTSIGHTAVLRAMVSK